MTFIQIISTILYRMIYFSNTYKYSWISHNFLYFGQLNQGSTSTDAMKIGAPVAPFDSLFNRKIIEITKNVFSFAEKAAK